MSDSRFNLRSCPCCGISERERVLELPAQSFCAANWTYSKEFAQILSIAPDMPFAIARCLGCAFVYAELEPDAAFLAKVYEEVIRHDDNLAANEVAKGYARRMHYIANLLELVHPGGPMRALDYGCGLGVTLRLIESAGVRSVGFDTSSMRLDYAANSSGTVVRTHRELQMDAPYDMIVCDNIIEHLPNPVETIRFLATVAKRGTVMFVSVPDCNARFLKGQRRAVRQAKILDMSLNPWEHLNYFDIEHLDSMLGRAGFLPILDHELVGNVDIGLRRDAGFLPRFKNACASGVRLARYALTGRTLRSPNCVFYRYAG